MLPTPLCEAIQALSFNTASLQEGQERLSERYRFHTSSYRTSLSEKEAYLVARLPATYAVLSHLFQKLQEQLIENSQPLINKILDVGSGPGTAIWAAERCFPDLHSVIAWEHDEEWIRLSQLLARSLEGKISIEWKHQDVLQNPSFPTTDLILFSYVLGEIDEGRLENLSLQLAQSNIRYLLFVEPGTPRGFLRIAKMRDLLLQHKLYPVAPCPHGRVCPLEEDEEKWCHFSHRLPRSSLHRLVKGGSLPYEDEKYSYFLASRQPFSLPHSRVIGHPKQRSGHVLLPLCTEQGIENKTISRKEKDLYKIAKKLEWGDPF